MIRGTTPTHTYYIPFDSSLIADIKIIYGQSDKPLFEKTKADCLLSENKVIVSLTAEETYKFDCKRTGQAQLEVTTTDGKVTKSEILIFPVGKCLKGV